MVQRLAARFLLLGMLQAPAVSAGPAQPPGFEEDGTGRAFVVREPGLAARIESARAVFLAGSPGAGAQRVEIRFRSAAADREGRGIGLRPGLVHDLHGADPARWRRSLRRWERARFDGLWPGAAIEWHAAGGTLEFDLRLAPGADPSCLELDIEGARSLSIEAGGALTLWLEQGTLSFGRPIAWQERPGGRDPVDARWSLHGGAAAFALGRHDPSRPLVVDPTVRYATYLGGGGEDTAVDVAVDAAGDVYVTGTTWSLDFPGAANGDEDGDAYVAKLRRQGDGIEWLTLLGGGARDRGYALAVTLGGSVVAAGATESGDFPLMRPLQDTRRGSFDAFVARLGPAGDVLEFSTLLGGGGSDAISGVALGPTGEVYVAGETGSSDYPTQSPLFTGRQACYDAFVSHLSADGSRLLYSTYFGGDDKETASSIAVDASGAMFLAGMTASSDLPVVAAHQPTLAGNFDAYLLRLDPTGQRIEFSTYLGGSAQESTFGLLELWFSGTAQGLAVDPAGDAVLVGRTLSRDFPVRGALQPSMADDPASPSPMDAFAARFSPRGELRWATYLGGSGPDEGHDVAIDGAGRVLLFGTTASSDLGWLRPLQAMSGGQVGFLARLEADGQALTLATPLGGRRNPTFGLALAASPDGDVALVGQTWTEDFRTHAAFQDQLAGLSDGFVVRLEPEGCALGPVGSTLKLARRWSGLELRWGDIPGATSYAVYQAALPGGPFLDLLGTADEGWRGVSAALPAGPLVFFRVGGANDCGPGPL